MKVMKLPLPGLPGFYLLHDESRWYLASPTANRSLSAVEQGMVEAREMLHKDERARACSRADTVAVALRSIAVHSQDTADRDPYSHGLANGLLLALSTLEGSEFCPLPTPAVYRQQLDTWAGRFRWYRAKGTGRVRSVWLACHA